MDTEKEQLRKSTDAIVENRGVPKAAVFLFDKNITPEQVKIWQTYWENELAGKSTAKTSKPFLYSSFCWFCLAIAIGTVLYLFA